ncbi:hypothetical protein E1200_24305 [Actinomadura sp. GC306]|uniref:sigma-70 family RNA polymerase sigma factor n=1 Tax=Actinomadura sp. GC306 TaxID=2530367 RepID=UPI00104D3BE2|nr:sigma-70 family RNA polymerase sigma factor [Actinomadura sp. GC306]TDC62852.1 hypothetical protein E1200_24305 [Actinomadura sp. GC306]
MAGEPWPGQNDDVRLANSLRAGDVIALTEVYDTYAPFLYDYCHGLLRDRVEAAGALRNAFIAAREHIDRLTEPERLRGWMYAIARKESMRRRDSPNRHTGQEAPEADDGLTEEQLARRTERRLLAHSALAALNGRQREAIDLLVRHDLDEVDLCGILGIPLEETLGLVERTRADLAASLHAALIAQDHWEDCPGVAALVESWPLPPRAAQALVRHIAGCPACAELQIPALPPDRLLSVLPIAAIPPDLRLDVLTAATAEDRAANRRAIAAWTEPFDEYGWPLPYEPTPTRARERPSRRRGRIVAAAAVAVGAVVLSAGAVSAFIGGGPDSSAAAPAPADSSEPVPSGQPEPTPTDPSPTAASPSPTKTKSPSKTPSPSATPSRTATTRPPSATPPRDTDEPEPPRRGTLSVEGCRMGNDQACTVRITAVGGTVNWRVAGTSGELAAGGAGRLAAGRSAEVTVRRTNVFCFGERSGSVSFSPGGSARVSYC